MKWLIRHTFLLLVMSVVVSNTATVRKTYRGSGELTNHVDRYVFGDYFIQILLVCNPTEVIHIEFIEVQTLGHDSLSTTPTRCPGTDHLYQKQCEGTRGICRYYPSCMVNLFNVTFQCIPETKIYPMCPGNRAMTIGTTQTVYYTTPQFTSTGGTYPNYTRCQCHAVAVGGGSVRIDLLFAELETRVGGCYDYISISTGMKYCEVDQGNDVSKTFAANETASFVFESDFSFQHRGGWLSVRPGSAGDRIEITCNEHKTYTTTTTIPTINAVSSSHTPTGQIVISAPLRLLPSNTKAYIAQPTSQAYSTSSAIGLPRQIIPNKQTVRGNPELTSYTRHYQYDDIRTVRLQCLGSRYIHISQLYFARNSQTHHSLPTDCTSLLSDEPINSCEGRPSGCSFEVSYQNYYGCYYINQMNITFQCIPDYRIHSMCPSHTTTTSLHRRPGYFTTPQFTNRFSNRYPSSSHCHCSIGYNRNNVTIKLLYASLEYSSTPGICYDYIGFIYSADEHRAVKYCNRTELQAPIQRSEATTFVFKSDISVTGRGGWFGVYPESSRGYVSVTCSKYTRSTTPRYTWTTGFRTTPTTTIYNWYQNEDVTTHPPSTIAAIIGGTVGTIVAVILLVMIITTVRVCVLRRRRRDRLARQRQSQQTRVFFVQRESRIFTSELGLDTSTSEDLPPSFASVAGNLDTPTAPSTAEELGYLPPPSYEDVMRAANS